MILGKCRTTCTSWLPRQRQQSRQTAEVKKIPTYRGEMHSIERLSPDGKSDRDFDRAEQEQRPFLTPSQGLPAIPVSREAQEQSKATGKPALTEEEVRAWATAQTQIGGWPSSIPITVGTVEFITQGELTDRGFSGRDRPDDALVCLVEIRGDFAVRRRRGGQRSTATVLYVRFDITTGNLLATGGPPPPPDVLEKIRRGERP
jgi:hypothetical protein